MSKITFQTSTPEKQGIPATAIGEFIERLSAFDFVQSFMLLRHDALVAECCWAPYQPEYRHELFSISKSFVSIAVGLAQDEGKLCLSDKLVDYFPEKMTPEVSSRMKSVTLRNLLTMSSGHKRCILMDLLPLKDWVKAFLESRLDYSPGTTFVYNSAATYMLAAVIRKVTGENVVDYLRPRIFEPLGIVPGKWDCCPMGINIGGWGFWLATKDLLQFGRFLLNRGCWNGRQLISGDYLREATSFEIETSQNSQRDWKLGYGYQFWQTSFNSFRADGACGQYIVVMPDEDIVWAVTAGMSDMQNILTAFWETIYPSLKGSPLPEDSGAVCALKKRIAACRLMPLSNSLNQIPDSCKYELSRNKLGLRYLEFHFTDRNCSCVFFRDNGEQETMTANYNSHCRNFLKLNENEIRVLEASAAWQDESELLIQVYAAETPYRDCYHIQFAQDQVHMRRTSNLTFLHDEWESLMGRKVAMP